MKKILIGFVCMGLAGMAAAQEKADDIINKYVAVMGGAEKLASIKTLVVMSTAVTPQGAEVTQTQYKVQDSLSRREINFGMGEMKMIVTPAKGWRSNMRNGGALEPVTEEQLKMMQSELDCNVPLFNYAAKGHKAELLGKEDVEGTECYKIKLTLKSGSDITYFIDAKTSYIIRESRSNAGMGGGGPRGGGPMNIDYSDYQTTPEGYVFPMKMSMGGMMGTMNVEKIEVNKPLDVAKLGKPE